MKSISIIVPVYNVEKYLDACMHSVINQTVKPLEVILVDDGSTDSSSIICDKYSKEYDNIHVIHQKNGGLSEARNTGLVAAKGEYIIFLDSDDTIIPETCNAFLSAIGDREVDIAIGNLAVIREDSRTVKMHTLSDSERILSGEEFLKTELKHNTMYAPVVQGVYSRQFLLDNQLFFVSGLLHEDEIFTPTAIAVAKQLLPTDIVFYNHMIRPNSITTQKDKTPNAKSIIKICDYLEKLVDTAVEDVELKRMILDHAVDLYYKVYIDADLLSKKEYRMSKDYLKRNAYSVKNRVRNLIYFSSERAFTFFERKRRKMQ